MLFGLIHYGTTCRHRIRQDVTTIIFLNIFCYIFPFREKRVIISPQLQSISISIKSKLNQIIIMVPPIILHIASIIIISNMSSIIYFGR